MTPLSSIGGRAEVSNNSDISSSDSDDNEEGLFLLISTENSGKTVLSFSTSSLGAKIAYLAKIGVGVGTFWYTWFEFIFG